MYIYLSLTLYVAVRFDGVNADLPNVGASIENGKSSLNTQNNFEIHKNNGECRDYTGRSVQSGMHFVPPGVDMCKLCICENGNAKSCRAVLCTPPVDCSSFQMGSSCCEFVCLDGNGSPTAPSSNGFISYFQHIDRTRLLILASAIAPSLIIVCCFVRCCYRKHRGRNHPIESEQDTLERDGLVHFNAFLKICDKAGKKLSAGDIGEIYMKFEFGFLRCYNDLPEAMRNTMDDEGYYRTGDIGYMKKGVVYILDKNRYISDRRNSNIRCSRF